MTVSTDTRPDLSPELAELELAWGLIANAGGGDWTRETPEWQAAAARWRERYHALLAAV